MQDYYFYTSNHHTLENVLPGRSELLWLGGYKHDFYKDRYEQSSEFPSHYQAKNADRKKWGRKLLAHI